MSSTIDLQHLEDPQDPPNLPEEPEDAALLRVTAAMERLFDVPVAYLALLGPESKVVTRIGSGDQYWGYLKTFPLAVSLAEPQIWRDLSLTPPYGAVHGDLRFVATATLRSSDGLDLGLLVVADVRPRPDFSVNDHQTLVEVANLLSAKMEIRMLACHARDSEMLLREAERRFRNITNSAPVMIVYSGVDAAASFVNQTWLDFTGRSRDEELGEGFADTFHPDFRLSVMQTYWDAFEERRPLLLEFPMRRHDGEYRWILARGMPRFRHDGSFTGYTGCLVDITDHRAAERNLRKQALCMAAVAEASGAFYLVLDLEGKIEQAGPSCQAACRPGTKPGAGARDCHQTPGRFLWEGCDAAVPEAVAVRDAVRQAVAGRAMVQLRTRWPSPCGGEAEMLWRFTPVMGEGDEMVAVTATVFDCQAAPGSSSVPVCGGGCLP